MKRRKKKNALKKENTKKNEWKVVPRRELRSYSDNGKQKPNQKKKEKQETNDIFRRLMNPMMEREGLHWKKNRSGRYFFFGASVLCFCAIGRGTRKEKKMETKDNGEKLGKQQLSSGRHPPGQRTKSAFSFFYPPPKRKNINSDLKLGKEKATYKSMSLDA